MTFILWLKTSYFSKPSGLNDSKHLNLYLHLDDINNIFRPLPVLNS